MSSFVIYHKILHHYRVDIFNLINSKIGIEIWFINDMSDGKTKNFRTIKLSSDLIKNLFFFIKKFKTQRINSILIPTQISDINNWFLVILSKIFRIRIISFGHGWNLNDNKFLPSKKFSHFLKYLIYKISSVNLIYEYAQATVLRHQIKNIDFRVFHNTIHIHNLKELRRNYDFKERYVLYLGSLSKDKNIGNLFSYYQFLSNHYSDIKLKIVGKGLYNPFLNVSSSRIIYLGAITDQNKLGPIISNAICVFIPGKIGLVANNSLAFGTPIIGFLPSETVKHAPEVVHIKNGYTGYLVDEKEPNDLLRAFDSILINRDNFRKNCIEYFDQNCNSEKMVEIITNSLLGN